MTTNNKTLRMNDLFRVLGVIWLKMSCEIFKTMFEEFILEYTGRC